MASLFEKTNVELELITDYDMLLMIEDGIRGGICHAIQRYAKTSNKYLNNYNNNKESSYIQYLDANNLYGMAMSEKLPIKGFKWMVDISGIDENFVKSYNKDNGKGYILKVDVDYPRELQNLHCDLPFLPEKMVVNTLKVHQVIEFDQEAWLKEYTNFNTELRKKAINDFEKDFFKLMNNANGKRKKTS